MKKSRFLGVTTALLAAAAMHAQTAFSNTNLVVTASNQTNNQLLVYSPSGTLLQSVSTQGQGGASGNAGGIMANGGLVAVVNFGSKSVSLFQRIGNTFHMTQSIPTVANPVSVAFGNNHLYILGATKVESHLAFGPFVSPNADGAASLLKGDGSAAQVGVVNNELIIAEKSNVIETVGLNSNGAVTGSPTLVQNIPSTVDTPFGLVTRGDDAYVTIAHSNQTSLVRNGKILTITGSGTQNSPCWLTLVGPFLYSSNSPSMSISRYAVYGQKIVQDAAVAAMLNGAPTDIASGNGQLSVIDGSGSVTHLSTFNMDEDGNLTLVGAVTINGAANGVAVVSSLF